MGTDGCKITVHSDSVTVSSPWLPLIFRVINIEVSSKSNLFVKLSSHSPSCTLAIRKFAFSFHRTPSLTESLPSLMPLLGGAEVVAAKE